jgi:uncharacterized Zn finger protein
MDPTQPLRPCPFCAHEHPVLAAVGRESVERIAVMCSECGAVGDAMAVTAARSAELGASRSNEGAFCQYPDEAGSPLGSIRL